MALLQPAPEVYDLFDDILLLCEGAPKFCLLCSFVVNNHDRIRSSHGNAIVHID